MTYYLVKLLISSALIVTVSELAKRSTTLGGLVASLPIVSYLGMIWLYIDTRDPQRVAALSTSIFWLVLPSLTLLITLPLLLKKISFVPALTAATLLMFAAYIMMLWLLRIAGYNP